MEYDLSITSTQDMEMEPGSLIGVGAGTPTCLIIPLDPDSP